MFNILPPRGVGGGRGGGDAGDGSDGRFGGGEWWASKVSISGFFLVVQNNLMKIRVNIKPRMAALSEY